MDNEQNITEAVPAESESAETPAAEAPETENTPDSQIEASDADAEESALMGDVFDKYRNADGSEKTEEETEPAAEAVEAAEQEQAPEASESEKPAESADTDVPEGVSEASEASEAAIAAPEQAPKAIKDGWDKLPPEIQESIASRERELMLKMTDQGREMQRVKPLSDRLNTLIEKYPAFANETPENLVEGAVRLAAVQAELDKNPLPVILDVAQRYGLMGHLQQIFTGQQPTPEQSANLQLQQQVADLQRQMTEQTSNPPVDIDNLVNQSLNEREALNNVNQFASENEHYEVVEPYLPQFIQTVQSVHPGLSDAETLREAYNMAVNALPETRAKLNAPGTDSEADGQAEAQPAAQKPTSKRNVQAIKAAAINVSTSGPGKDAPKTEEQVLGEVWDRMTA